MYFSWTSKELNIINIHGATTKISTFMFHRHELSDPLFLQTKLLIALKSIEILETVSMSLNVTPCRLVKLSTFRTCLIHPPSAPSSPSTFPGVLGSDGGGKTHLRHIFVTFQNTLVLIHTTLKANDLQKIRKLYIYIV